MMIKDRMVARPSRTNLRFIQKPKKAFFLQRPPWREQESRPQRDNHRKQPEFLPCPHVCLLYGKLLRERLDRSTILGGFLQSELSFPAPFHLYNHDARSLRRGRGVANARSVRQSANIDCRAGGNETR